MTDYKEKIKIYTKYLEKTSNWVGCKYLRLHRWISQGDSHVELSIFQVWTLILQVEFVISQLGGDSITWRWFATWFVAWRPFRSQGPFLQAISQAISQLRNEGVGLRKGTRVPRGGLAAMKHPAKFCSSFHSTSRSCLPTTMISSFQLRFVHRLKCWTLTSQASKWYRVCIKWTPWSAQNVSCSCCPLEFHVRFLSFSSLHSWLALATNYKALKFGFFM